MVIAVQYPKEAEGKRMPFGVGIRFPSAPTPPPADSQHYKNSILATKPLPVLLPWEFYKGEYFCWSTVMEELHFAALLKGRGDTNLNLCLSAAENAMSLGEFADAERMYKRGLEWSEQRFGAQSAAVGLVLIQMIKLYEVDGTQRSTLKLESRLQGIFRRYFFRAIAAKLTDNH